MKDAGKSGIAAIISANIIFGLNIPVTKSLIADWMSPLGYTTTRMAFGTVVFWAISYFTEREKMDVKDLIRIILAGLLGYLGTQLLFSQAMIYTTPVTFSLLMALTPVIVLVISALFLKESVTLRKIAGLLFSICGAGLIILTGNPTTKTSAAGSIGILFTILCVLCYSAYLILTREVARKYTPVTVAKWMFLGSALAVLPFGIEGLPHQAVFSEKTGIVAISLLSFALLFSTLLAFFLMPYALKRLEASTASVYLNLQPIVASIAALMIGQDKFGYDKLIAAIFVLVGVRLVSTPDRRMSK